MMTSIVDVCSTLILIVPFVSILFGLSSISTVEYLGIIKSFARYVVVTPFVINTDTG